MSNYRQIIQYDKDLGHKYVEKSKSRVKYGNDAYFIETDQFGFRNSTSKVKSDFTILVLGDSFAAGDGVCNKHRFSDLIQNELDCNVVNLAVSGYGVDQQLLAYEKYGDHIDHDIVLFVPHLDDLKRNLLSKREGIDQSTKKPISIPKPYFEIDKEKLVIKNVPVPRERIQLGTENTELDTSFINRVSNYANRRVLKKHVYPEFSDANSKEWILMKLIMERLFVKTNGKPVLIAPIPYYVSVTYKEKPKYLDVLRNFNFKNLNIADINTCLVNNFDIDNNEIFLTLCGHFTHKGNKIIANELIKQLKKNYNLKSRKEPIKFKQVNNNNYVLGISCFYHDSAAALIADGKVVAAAQEERFTRVKHDKSFPYNAIHYCMEEAGILTNQLNAVVYYDFETWTIERVLHNSLAIEDKIKGDEFWKMAQKSLYKKLRLNKIIKERLNYTKEIFKVQHHVSHAAGAYYPSSFNDAAILVLDGVGEWACSSIGIGEGNKIKILKQQNYPHSLGLLYSAFTYFCGFKVNSGEYKLMGLAPYGKPIYAELIMDKLITIHSDGSIFLNMKYFSFLEGDKMTNENFAKLFGGAERSRESDIARREMDLASSIQYVTEKIVIKMANHAYELTGKRNLVMSGGVALNCVSNGKLFENTPFEEFYFQPASGDAGGALGCALQWYYENHNTSAIIAEPNALLGPQFTNEEVLAFLNTKGVKYHVFDDGFRGNKIANLIFKKKIIGHFDGRMEFGPRALGNRSIIANPLDVEMQSKLNLKIKFRESFRPFAPIYAEDKTQEYFDFDRPSPYMLIVRNVKQSLLVEQEDLNSDNMIDIVNQKRSELPAITHVDNSARLQSVNKKDNPRFYEILSEFEKLSGKAVLINTSFNVRGEPIVCTLHDAYRCFMRTNMDILVLNDFFLIKEEQPEWQEDGSWQETFELD